MTDRTEIDAKRRMLLRVAGLSLGGVTLAQLGIARAQMGERAIKFILPVATASGVDTITRAAEPSLAKALGQPDNSDDTLVAKTAIDVACHIVALGL